MVPYSVAVAIPKQDRLGRGIVYGIKARQSTAKQGKAGQDERERGQGKTTQNQSNAWEFGFPDVVPYRIV